jgi:enolase-phosphatase E1
VTVSLSALHIRAVVLDIEGTTTPVDFVYKVLFPYARAHTAAYLAREWASPACREAVALLREEYRQDEAEDFTPAVADFNPVVVTHYVASLMDQDRKSPGLKRLQGLVWERGYRDGELQGDVYADVAPALERWTAQGLGVFIYSSGSVLAQRMLFGSTRIGDLTPFLQGYFDTTVGPKTASASYAQIVDAIGMTPTAVVFISDVPAELDAAGAAGLRTVLCVRPGANESSHTAHAVIHDFRELLD